MKLERVKHQRSPVNLLCKYCGSDRVTSLTASLPNDKDGWDELRAEHSVGCPWVDNFGYAEYRKVAQ